MIIILRNFKVFTFLLLFLLFSSKAKSQCSITTTINSSSLTCGVGSLSTCNGVLYIGDGITSMSLIMNSALNLTCLGPIQLIIRNGASMDFSSGNDYLTLATGSSITFEGTGTLIGGSCNASERIYIGADLVATCNGQGPGADYTFGQLVANGGFNYVKTTPTAICGSGTSSIAVSVVPTPTASTTYKLYTSSNSLTPISSVTSSVSPFSATLSTPVISSTTTYYVEATTGLTTTPRKAVVVTVNSLPNNITNGFAASTICIGGSPQLTYDADDTTFSTPYSITYKNDVTLQQYTVAILSAAPYSFTPADNPTTNAGYTLISISNASCTRTSGFMDAGANLSVRPMAIATISGTTSVCVGVVSPNITFTNPRTVSLTVTYNINGGSNQTVDINALSSTNVAVATNAPGTFVYNLVSAAYQTGANCSSTITGSATVTVNPNLPVSVSVVASPSGAICSGTSVTFTATPTNEGTLPTYQWYNGATQISGATASTYTTNSLANGDAIRVIMTSNATCTMSNPASSNIVTMTISAPATWNGSSWTNGPPTSSSAQAVIFNGSYSSTGNIEACSCQVNSGTVTINTGHTLKVTNGVTVSGGALIFEDKASLVQVNNVSNSGNITYKRKTPAIIDTDYVYWSSPVFGYTLGAVSPNTLAGKMYSYDAFANPENWKQESSATVMVPGKGYIIRGPEYVSPLPPFPTPFSASFVGVPNNGIITIPIGAANTSNLIGNPYPSALDADSFLRANSAILEGTIYFWTHNTAIQLATDILNGSAGSGDYAYTSDDYASYNFTGGVGVAGTGTAATTVGFDGSSVPSGKIGSGQSFFATSIANGQVATFTNDMRVGVGSVTGDNSQFFKSTSNSKAIEVIEKNRIWLNLSNNQGAFKQTLVGYISGATNDYDNGYDGESFDGNEFIDFYSVNNDKNLVIQGRALPFEESDTIPLGYRSSISGDFTISIDQVDGLFAGKAVYLKDNVTNSTHNLNQSAYNFKTETGTFDDRFVLSYTNKTLATDDFNALEKGVLISNKNKEVRINSSGEIIDSVLIYDLLGRQVYSKTNVDSKELLILNMISAKQTLLIKVGLQGGEVINNKIIY